MYVIFRRTTSPCQNQQELRSFSSWCRTTAAFVWVPGARSQACLSSRWNGFSRRVLVRLRRKGTAMNHNRCVSCCVFGARFHVDRLSPSLSRDPPQQLSFVRVKCSRPREAEQEFPFHTWVEFQIGWAHPTGPFQWPTLCQAKSIMRKENTGESLPACTERSSTVQFQAFSLNFSHQGELCRVKKRENKSSSSSSKWP